MTPAKALTAVGAAPPGARAHAHTHTRRRRNAFL